MQIWCDKDLKFLLRKPIFIISNELLMKRTVIANEVPQSNFVVVCEDCFVAMLLAKTYDIVITVITIVD